MPKIDPKDFFSGGNVQVVSGNVRQVDSNGANSTPNQPSIGKKPSTLSKIEQGITNFGKNLTNDFKNRGQAVTDSFNDALHNKQSGFSAGVQTVGQVGGAVGDIINRATQPVTDKTIKPIAEKATQIPAVQNAITKYTEWARQHPEASRNLEAAVNITNLLGAGEAESAVKSAGTDALGAAKNGIKKAAVSGLDSAGEAANTIKNGVKPATSFGSRMLVGEDLHGALTHFAENTDNVNAFRSGTKTYQSIADKVVQAHDTFDKATFKEFQNMKKGLPDIKVPNSNIIGEVKQITANAPNLLPKEKSTVQNIINMIRGNKDQSIKGLLDMRSEIDRAGFIRAGEEFKNSNKVISQIRNKINEMAIERAKNYDLVKGTNYSKDILQGLKKASSNIDLLDRIKANLTGSGRNVEQAATKIRQIIGKIDDPTEYEATKNLLKEIEGRTKTSLVNDLESARTAQIINKTTKLKGGFSHPLNSASELLNKGAVKSVEAFQKMKKTPKR